MAFLGRLVGTRGNGETAVSRREVLRRGLRLAAAGTVAAAFAGLALPNAATVDAGEDMCEGDPIVSIDGSILQIVVRMPVSKLKHVSAANPVLIRIYVPSDVKHVSVVAYTGPIPERVEWVPVAGVTKGKDKFKVKYAVFAPHGNGNEKYKLQYVATTKIDQRRHDFDSGKWNDGDIDMPRVQ